MHYLASVIGKARSHDGVGGETTVEIAEPGGPPNGAKDAGFQGRQVGAPSVTSSFGVRGMMIVDS